MSESEVIVSSPEKKEKKDKKDKKKDKKKKKDKQKIDALGESVDSLSLKSSDDYDDDRFKPVRNPHFNPALTSPLTSPTTSRNSIVSDSNGSNNDEKWTISSRNKDMPLTQSNAGGATAEKSPLTPAELQGYAAQKFVPTNSYAHLDPSKSENAYAAFNHLQKVIMASKDGVIAANQSPRNDSAAAAQQQQQQQHVQQQQTSQQKNQPQQQRAQGQPQQARSVAQQPSPSKLSPPANQSPPIKQQQHRQPQQRPPSQPQQQQSSKLKPRAERLADGAPVLQYVRALWNYTAQVNM